VKTLDPPDWAVASVFGVFSSLEASPFDSGEGNEVVSGHLVAAC
jgi:hypothetical protein